MSSGTKWAIKENLNIHLGEERYKPSFVTASVHHKINMHNEHPSYYNINYEN